MKQVLLFLVLLPLTFHAQEIVQDEVQLMNGDIVLPGTLSYPKVEDKVPLVIFVHGSGNGDRNGNQGRLLYTNHIQLLADSLNVRGLAFYRFDKRTATEENIAKIKNPSLYDFVDDVKIAITHFYEDQRFSGIHIIGHSQGALVGMLAVGNEGKSYTSLAGPGFSIDKTLLRQINAQSKELGKVAAQHVQELMETDTILQVNPFLMSIFAPQNQSFFKEWIGLDPAKEIEKLKVPVLIVNGDADLQVTTEDAQILQQGNTEATLVIIPKMNHALKEVNDQGENQRSYQDPSFPLSSLLVQTIHEFIQSNE